MQIPVRLALAGRGTIELGLIAAIAISTAVFSATPLILSDVIETLTLGSTAAGLVSGAQLAGFVLTSFLAGRFAKPSPRIFVTAVLVLSTANALSSLAGALEFLLLMRFVAGLGLGLLTWLAWAAVFGDQERMGSIAVVGPIAGVIVSPLVGLAVELSSFRAVYIGLAVVGIAPLLRIPVFADAEAPRSTRSSGGAPVAYAVIIALACVSFGGSAVFVFSGVIAEDELGISPGLFSLVMSANAAAGIPSSSWSGRRPLAGLWLAGCGIAAIVFTSLGSAVLGAAAIILWGFMFWMGVPGSYAVLSRVSRFPAERAGDAQAAMAVGRIFGPVVGGSLIALGSEVTLGLVAGGVMIVGGCVIAGVDAARPASTPID